MTAAAGIHIHLLVYQFVVHLDGIVVNLIVAAQLNLKFGSHGNVEDERIGSILLHIHRLLLLRRQGIAQHLNLILLNILVDLLAYELVNLIHFHAGSHLTLNQAHWYLTCTETWHIGLLTIILQCLLDIFLEVCLLYRDGHQAIHFVGILECYFHLVLYLINC